MFDKPRCSRRQAILRTLSSAVVLAKNWWTGRTAAADDQPDSPRQATEPATLAIEKGLQWLAARQASDGGFGDRRSYARNVGVCALCGTAFLAHQGNRGPYAAAIRRATDYLLAHAQSSGFIVEDYVRTHAPMYGHGFATMYLGQIFGSDTRSAVSEVLRKAVGFIVTAQQENGAWRYTSSPEDADTSITTCQMMALLSARDAGINVPRAVIERAVRFLRRCQNPDGGFRYRLIDLAESLFPRSAAAVVALVAAGYAADPAVARGREYLSIPTSVPTPNKAEYYYYGRFYAAQAAWHAGPQAWDHWYPAARDELLAVQSPAGHWCDAGIGDEYATAMALIVLQFPFEVIPLFSRRRWPRVDGSPLA